MLSIMHTYLTSISKGSQIIPQITEVLILVSECRLERNYPFQQAEEKLTQSSHSCDDSSVSSVAKLAVKVIHCNQPQRFPRQTPRSHRIPTHKARELAGDPSLSAIMQELRSQTVIFYIFCNISHHSVSYKACSVFQIINTENNPRELLDVASKIHEKQLKGYKPTEIVKGEKSLHTLPDLQRFYCIPHGSCCRPSVSISCTPGSPRQRKGPMCQQLSQSPVVLWIMMDGKRKREWKKKRSEDDHLHMIYYVMSYPQKNNMVQMKLT
ncbi:hypothetical protein EK904_002857 [Melospiza melodia maxima]|nr:hypothetical protein EK904_002857 [Melospiza melodia maxima]